MANPGRGTFKVGGVVFPLTTTSGNDLIVDGDPLIYNLLQFFKSILVTYLGDRFSAISATANLVDAGGNLITAPVKQLVPYSPADYLEEVQYKFPLLSAARNKETYKEKTREWYDISCELQVLYMLPPLTAAQMYQFDTFRSLVRSVILDRLELGWDPSYKNGELIFQTAGIEQISLVKSDYLGLENPKNVKTFFPTIMMTFDVKERKNHVLGSFPDLTDISGSVKLSDGYQPSDYDMIDFKLDL